MHGYLVNARVMGAAYMYFLSASAAVSHVSFVAAANGGMRLTPPWSIFMKETRPNKYPWVGMRPANLGSSNELRHVSRVLIIAFASRCDVPVKAVGTVQCPRSITGSARSVLLRDNGAISPAWDYK